MDKYVALVQQKVTQNWAIQDSAPKGSVVMVRVRVAPGGAVLDANIQKTSGNAILDRSAISAVFKASPLPVPTGEAFERFREFELILRRPDSI